MILPLDKKRILFYNKRMMQQEMHMTKEELAKTISNGMFADRDTLAEAFEYVDVVAKGSDNAMAVWTAVMVVANTIAKEVKELADA
jgi:hypothetical protein